MEDLDKRGLYKAIHKLLYQFYYVSAIIIIWPHWPENLKALLEHNIVQFIIVDRIPDVSLEELKLTAPTFYTYWFFFDILLFELFSHSGMTQIEIVLNRFVISFLFSPLAHPSSLISCTPLKSFCHLFSFFFIFHLYPSTLQTDITPIGLLLHISSLSSQLPLLGLP